MKPDHLATRFTKVLLIVASIGCVVGQKVAVKYVPEAGDAGAEGGTVVVTVADQRPFIVNGEKDPDYIGRFRGGFGNPWNVKTEGNVALAELLRRDLSADLRALGFALPVDSAARRLEVTIADWNFDAYINTKFWYRLDLRVTDGDGNPLFEHQLAEGNVVINGSVLTGAKSAFKREYPGIYRSIIKKIARDNPKLLEALHQ